MRPFLIFAVAFMARVGGTLSVPGDTQKPTLEVRASLGEFAIFVSGRVCDDWWPEVRKPAAASLFCLEQLTSGFLNSSYLFGHTHPALTCGMA